MSTSSLQVLPTELLYRILDSLDTRTICVSFRYVCRRFHMITDVYDRYVLDFELVSKTEFDLICRIIRPENVRSLTLCENIHTINQMVLFNQLIDIHRFIQLRSVTLSCFDDWLLDHILKHFGTCSLTSFSINIEKTPVKRFGIPRSLFDTTVVLSASLLSIVAQPTLQKLYLHIPYQINESSWPNQCTLKYLNINHCTLDQYCIILQHSPLLKTIILTNCDALIKDITEISLSTFALLSFGQLTSLTVEKIDQVKMNILKFFLSLTRSLFHLQL